MSASTSYNFLPPLNQYAQVTNEIGNINRLDEYLPQYNLTFGSLTPLVLNSSNVPVNLNGASLSSSGGNSQYIPYAGSYVGPPATPFMMITYGQTNNGIIQFVLMDGANLPDITNEDNTPDSTQYYFAPFNDTIDFSRVVQLYYTIDSSKNITFYDANLVNQNPTSNTTDYQLFAYTEGSFSGNYNTYAAWPSKNTPWKTTQPDQGSQAKMTFLFNEFVDTTNNLNEYTLKVGKFYHPYSTSLSYVTASSDDYITYCSSGYFTGNYCPGYPVNFNYIFSPVRAGQVPVISNGLDTATVNTGSGNVDWGFQVSLNVYNFSVNSINNSQSASYNPNSFESGIVPNYAQDDDAPYETLINAYGNSSSSSDALGVLNCTCSNNNECATDSDSYYKNNCNTIQAGIVQYLIYQFLPFSQIKSPYLSVIPQISLTPYTSYATIPVGTTVNSGVDIITQNLIDGSTGNTGYTQSNTSLITGWMKNPLNTSYNCTGQVLPTEYCGFLDYYESLFGSSYAYGFCGGTGQSTNLSQFQVGACEPNNLCLPNFNYVNDPTQAPFICVDYQTGVTQAQMTAYIQTLPPNPTKNVSIQYPPYTMAANYPSSNDAGNIGQVNQTKSNLFYYAGIVLLVIVGIVFLILLISGIRKSVKNRKIYRQYTRII